MKVAAIALVALGLTAGAATAAERVTDLDYMKASRCKGIAEGMGQADTASLDAFLKEQKKGRQIVLFLLVSFFLFLLKKHCKVKSQNKRQGHGYA